MKFTLEINCDNDAFSGDDLYPEIARLLRVINNKIMTEGSVGYGKLYDLNGNAVGRYDLDIQTWHGKIVER